MTLWRFRRRADRVLELEREVRRLRRDLAAHEQQTNQQFGRLWWKSVHVPATVKRRRQPVGKAA